MINRALLVHMWHSGAVGILGKTSIECGQRNIWLSVEIYGVVHISMRSESIKNFTISNLGGDRWRILLTNVICSMRTWGLQGRQFLRQSTIGKLRKLLSREAARSVLKNILEGGNLLLGCRPFLIKAVALQYLVSHTVFSIEYTIHVLPYLLL